jgi:transformation/transcription domain-associated protein
MLMFQLYPRFLRQNIPTLIQVMMEALSLRAPTTAMIEKQYQQQQQAQQPQPQGAGSSDVAPPIQQSTPQATTETTTTTTTNTAEGGGAPGTGGDPKLDDVARRSYFSRCRELVAAQAKTLSFLTYLLRGFSNDLKPYEERLATNVVALMSTCPREFVSTRKELLVASRHLLNSEFRNGFFRHVDSLLDEKVLMGVHHRYSEQTALRPLGYAALSDLVQHVRGGLTLPQISKVVSTFSRVLHDTSLPMSTQYTSVRTLLSVIDAAFQNKDPNPQTGRDILVRVLRTLVEKFSCLKTVNVTHSCNSTPTSNSSIGEDGQSHLKKRETLQPSEQCGDKINDVHSSSPLESKDCPLKDQKNMIRAIVVGMKTLIWYINNYRTQREKDKSEFIQPRLGANEEVYSGLSKITQMEQALIDEYVVLAFPCMKILQRESSDDADNREKPSGERSSAEQYRDTLTYFAAAFTTFDGYDLRRILGRRLEVFVDAVRDDPTTIIVPRHLLSANSTTSFEFCTMMLNFLVDRMDHLVLSKEDDIQFVTLNDEDTNASSGSNPLCIFQQLSEGDSSEKGEMKQTSAAYLQLFERILKSLSSYPDNERALRPHLKRIVSTCLRSSFEKTDFRTDNYCMLLRYVFRSISAGKFEESYRELLPLIPAVLNGLFRVLSSTDDVPLRHTLIELVLTIPARLSSLLPHMNLLLRVIVLALVSCSDDLVNLG